MGFTMERQGEMVKKKKMKRTWMLKADRLGLNLGPHLAGDVP